MRRGQIRTSLGLVVVLLAASAATAQAQSRTGQRTARTTVPTPYLTVKVTMTDSKFTLSKHSGPQEWDARFVIHNTGTKPHAFDFHGASGAYESNVNTLVQPGQSKVMILFLNRQGATLHYFGSLAADRNNTGMQGVFKIGKCVNLKQKGQVFGGYTTCAGG